jgi:DNA repair protein RecO (recombination protein O)
MGNPRSYQTQGIILKQTKLGEFDKIVTVYTPEHGKLRAVAKGACRPRSKLGGNVEPLTHSLLYLARGRNLDIITQSETIDGFLALKSDLWHMACGLYLLELVDCFTAEGGESRSLFHLLLDTLHELSDPGSSEIILRYFELHLLHHLGYRPQLRRCVGCDSQLRAVVNFLSPGKGGLLCPDCSAEEARNAEEETPMTPPRLPLLPLSVEALKVLRLWQRCDCATARRVRLQTDLSRELERTLQKYITHILQRELKSLTWLRDLGRGNCRYQRPVPAQALDNNIGGD